MREGVHYGATLRRAWPALLLRAFLPPDCSSRPMQGLSTAGSPRDGPGGPLGFGGLLSTSHCQSFIPGGAPMWRQGALPCLRTHLCLSSPEPMPRLATGPHKYVLKMEMEGAAAGSLGQGEERDEGRREMQLGAAPGLRGALGLRPRQMRAVEREGVARGWERRWPWRSPCNQGLVQTGAAGAQGLLQTQAWRPPGSDSGPCSSPGCLRVISQPPSAPASPEEG